MNEQSGVDPAALDFVNDLIKRDDDIFETCYAQIALILMYSFAILSSEVEKVAPLDRPYVHRRLFIAFMVYQALFLKGKPTAYRTIERGLGDLLKCSVCKSSLKARKAEVPRLLISERIVCGTCHSDIAVPILWLMSLGDLEVSL